MIKKWIIKIFNIKTYEKEYEKYERLYQDALTDIEVIISVAKNYKRELENLKASFNNNMVEEMDEDTSRHFVKKTKLRLMI